MSNGLTFKIAISFYDGGYFPVRPYPEKDK